VGAIRYNLPEFLSHKLPYRRRLKQCAASDLGTAFGEITPLNSPPEKRRPRPGTGFPERLSTPTGEPAAQS
jgi:hypothetical protein